MHVIVVRLRAAELSARMGEMRQWLDRSRIQAGSFRYEMTGANATVRVGFNTAVEAEAFRTAFDGVSGQ